MKKIYCDVCGKEIQNHENVWILGLNPTKDSGFDMTQNDVCKDCSAIIYNCVSMMKETGWKPDFHEKLNSNDSFESDRADYVLYEIERQTGIDVRK